LQFGSNISGLMQQVMAMRSPELLAVLPQVEAQPFQDRVALVRRGYDNLSSVIKHWDKFADILAAQRSMTKSQVKAKGKDLKNVRSKLEMALRLTDPKVIPAPFRGQAESAFNVLAAWFTLNQDYMESVYARPSLSRSDIGALELAPAALTPAITHEVYSDGVGEARRMHIDDLDDILDSSGRSSVH
jgi:hypothetical protein